mmetsp:Transcript_17491/g.50788  ORF Transcript_17491/g.50788 Transcript_17491/m.50788 type:complete len:233 (+) Transcript_17491:1184-1882(+)
MTTSTSTSGPSRYSSSMKRHSMSFFLVGRCSSARLLPSTAGRSRSMVLVLTSAPELMTVDSISSLTWWKASYSCSSESAFLTPRDAAPEMGLSTAGKPTCAMPAARSAVLRMSELATVARPASFMAWRVECLLRARSMADAGDDGRPSALARRATMGTDSSQNVQTPAARPTTASSSSARITSSASLKTDSASCSMLRGMNFLMMCSSTSLDAQLSGLSMITEETPSSLARW